MSIYFSPDAAEQLIDIMGRPLKTKPYKGITLGKANIKEFDGAQPFIRTDEIYTDEFKDEFFLDVRPDVLSRPFSQAMIVKVSADSKAIGIFSASTMSIKEARGRVKRIAPNMVKYTTGIIRPDTSEVETRVSIWALRSSGDPQYTIEANNNFGSGEEIDHRKLCWEHITSNLMIGPDAVCEANSHIQIALGVAFTNEYNWQVYLREEEGIGITLPTTPEGTKEIFRLRDIPPGKKRRAALINWVKEHYRRRAWRSDDMIFVKKHLRGATEFTWDGLYCKILLPVEASKALRERARASL